MPPCWYEGAKLPMLVMPEERPVICGEVCIGGVEAVEPKFKMLAKAGGKSSDVVEGGLSIVSLSVD
jgi:hypothetical protein